MMQAGFAMLCAGSLREKNIKNVRRSRGHARSRSNFSQRAPFLAFTPCT